jgi:hypothetical protein
MGSMHTGLEDRASDFDKLAAYFANARRGVGLIVTGGIAPESWPAGSSRFPASSPGRGKCRASTASVTQAVHEPTAAHLHADPARRPLRLPPAQRGAVEDQVADQSRSRRASCRVGRGTTDQGLRELRQRWRATPATTASRSWAPRAI